MINPIYCNRVCYNGGVCNVQNGQQICICPIGVTGLSCEYQGSLFSIVFYSKKLVLSVGGVTISPIYCNRICFNGGVCNVQNGLQICVCPLGFTGPNCEVQGSLFSIIVSYSKNFLLHEIRYSNSLCSWLLSSWNLL